MDELKFNETINKLRDSNISDVDRNNLLLELTNDFKATSIELSNLKSDNEKLKKDNTDYAELNNKLFLQVTASKVAEDDFKEDDEKNEDETKMSFDELFQD